MVHTYVGHVRDSGDITEGTFFSSVNERFCEILVDVMWSQVLGSNTRYTCFLQLTYKAVSHNGRTVLGRHAADTLTRRRLITYYTRN